MQRLTSKPGLTTMRIQTLPLQKIQMPMGKLGLTTIQRRMLVQQKTQMPMGKLGSTTIQRPMRAQQKIQQQTSLSSLRVRRSMNKLQQSLGMARSE